MAPGRFKEAVRSMANPTQGDVDELKGKGRYLIVRPRLVSKFACQSGTDVTTICTDSD